MFNRELFDKAIDEVGVRKSFLAKKLGITPAAFYYKINSQREWKASEIATVSKCLHLSDEDIRGIFFG